MHGFCKEVYRIIEMTYSVGSLYAGVGGICLGFQQAGFNLIWANEYDKNACITYRNNFDHKLIEGDVLSLDINSLEPVDVLCAGFPCQPFSVAGYRKGFNDHRGNHFFKVMDFVDTMNPKVIFLENVKNLVTHDNGNTFRIIRDSIIERGYSFDAKVLNTKDYGNIPHNRERIFIVAFNEEKTNNAQRFFDFPSPVKLTKSIHDIIVKEKLDDSFYYGEDKWFYAEFQKQITDKNAIYQWRRKYVRENKTGCCPTLTANMGTGGNNVPIIKTDYGFRKLTPEECFEFQGFPVKEGKYLLPDIARSHLYKQAGNSVSVPVIKSIACNILQALNGVNVCRELSLF